MKEEIQNISAVEEQEEAKKLAPRYEDCVFIREGEKWVMIPKLHVFEVNAIGSNHPGAYLTISSIAYDHEDDHEDSYYREFGITSQDIAQYEPYLNEEEVEEVEEMARVNEKKSEEALQSR